MFRGGHCFRFAGGDALGDAEEAGANIGADARCWGDAAAAHHRRYLEVSDGYTQAHQPSAFRHSRRPEYCPYDLTERRWPEGLHETGDGSSLDDPLGAFGVTRHRDDWHVRMRLAKTIKHLHPCHRWQREVQQDDIGLERRDVIKPFFARRRDLNAVAGDTEELVQKRRDAALVFHNQNAARRSKRLHRHIV
jgi:hypothetical protein